MAPRIAEVSGAYKRELHRLHSDRFCRLVLFGSRAREDHREDSDIDLLVVLRGEVDPNIEIAKDSEIVARLSLEHDVVLMPVFVSTSEYLLRQSPLLMNIRTEGITV